MPSRTLNRSRSVGFLSASSVPQPTVDGRWYSADSAWNKPIPVGTPAHPNSTGFVNALINNYRGFGGAVIVPTDVFGVPSAWVCDNSTALQTVWLNFPTVCHASDKQVPIPAGANPSSGGDPEPSMVIMNRDTGEEWGLWRCSKPGDTPLTAAGSGSGCSANAFWQSITAEKMQNGWRSKGSSTLSARASQTNEGAGLLRPRDWQMPAGSTWDHALAWAYENNLSGSFVYPATATDGQDTDATKSPPMGSRWQLDPAVNVSTWPSLQDSAYGGHSAEFIRQLARTLQVYGMIIVDSGSGLVTENQASSQSSNADADPPHNGTTAPWNVSPFVQYLPSDLFSSLRVIDWTVWTGK